MHEDKRHPLLGKAAEKGGPERPCFVVLRDLADLESGLQTPPYFLDSTA